MRLAALAAALALILTAAHGGRAESCSLGLGETPSPATGEHSLVIHSTCAIGPAPRFALTGRHGSPLGFTYVWRGGPRGSHSLLFDKYRCDVRTRDVARAVRIDGATLHFGSSLIDWCPPRPESEVVDVFLGPRRRAPASWRDVARHPQGQVWPCGALRAALAHGARVDASASCATALAGLHAGSPRIAATEALGAPSSGGARCSVWRWPPATGAIDGARICFADGRATLVQTAQHG